MRRILAWILLVASLAAASGYWFWPMRDTNFSQHAGFDAYFTAHPPSGQLPSDAERELLRQFRPRFFAAPGEEGPISFYGDYIANGSLAAGDGRRLDQPVTQELLNRHKDEPAAEFTHTGVPGGSVSPVIFARLDHAQLDLGNGPEDFTMLTYNAVFRRSGLPLGLPDWQRYLLDLVADTRDWHQLDHYTAATIVLDPAKTPVALMLQQHNYQRTYIFGETVELPGDRRALVDIAAGSNELYPHRDARTLRRAVSFISPRAFRYMIGAAASLRFTADDITKPGREVDYRLAYLAHSDAFYTFKGFLGERRRMPGRDGPPGADYKTLPEFMPWKVILPMGYWRDGNRGDMDRFDKAFSASQDNDAYLRFAAAQAGVLGHSIGCARKIAEAHCSFR